ncbi:antirestriction protein ArdC [Gellertiella hungarica]|uniref:Antirestriction protein ArdC n=1 Tax=Gellertiella hungarica TaxID=1572859 RepID=A0A7W6J917_9HYPH|nr:antirestriction protein ArdC [Gellertiella hungarica]
MQSVKDTYQRITDTIIQQLEAGTKPWIWPWRGNSRRSATPLRASGEAYRGINVVMLWLSGQLAGYDENTWMTYRQAQELGAQVRKGEQGTLVVKYGTFTPKEQEADDRAIPYLKGYTVFNVEQIDNLPDRFKSPAEAAPIEPVPVIDHVETFIRATGAKIAYGGKQACYRPGPDDIQMPERGRSARFIFTARFFMSSGTGAAQNHALIVTLAGGSGARPTQWRSLLPYLDSLHRLSP